MTGLVRKATLLAVCGLLTAGVAMAHVPDPANSECNSPGLAAFGFACPLKAHIFVVGNRAGVPDPIGQFCVTVRDFNNVPLEQSSVVLDFSDCDVQLCKNQLDASVTVDCGSQTVRKLTNASGVACFRVQGKTRPGRGYPVCTGAAKLCVKVYADGQLICSADAPTFDMITQSLQDGVNGNDISEFTQIWLRPPCDAGIFLPRINYDCTNQVINGNDLSQLLKVWLLPTFLGFGGSPANCAGVKDPNLGPKCP